MAESRRSIVLMLPTRWSGSAKSGLGVKIVWSVLLGHFRARSVKLDAPVAGRCIIELLGYDQFIWVWSRWWVNTVPASRMGGQGAGQVGLQDPPGRQCWVVVNQHKRNSRSQGGEVGFISRRYQGHPSVPPVGDTLDAVSIP